MQRREQCRRLERLQSEMKRRNWRVRVCACPQQKAAIDGRWFVGKKGRQNEEREREREEKFALVIMMERGALSNSDGDDGEKEGTLLSQLVPDVICFGGNRLPCIWHKCTSQRGKAAAAQSQCLAYSALALREKVAPNFRCCVRANKAHKFKGVSIFPD